MRITSGKANTNDNFLSWSAIRFQFATDNQQQQQWAQSPMSSTKQQYTARRQRPHSRLVAAAATALCSLSSTESIQISRPAGRSVSIRNGRAWGPTARRAQNVDACSPCGRLVFSRRFTLASLSVSDLESQLIISTGIRFPAPLYRSNNDRNFYLGNL